MLTSFFYQALARKARSLSHFSHPRVAQHQDARVISCCHSWHMVPSLMGLRILNVVSLCRTYASLFHFAGFHNVSTFLSQNNNKPHLFPHALVAFYEQASSCTSWLKAFSSNPLQNFCCLPGTSLLVYIYNHLVGPRHHIIRLIHQKSLMD